MCIKKQFNHRKFNQQKTVLVLASCMTIGLNSAAQASESKGWYLEPIIGLSELSGFTASGINVLGQSGSVDIDVDSGFTAGLGVGYRYSDAMSVELAWEYRTNDSVTTLPDSTQFTDGNYASNTFYLNGEYSWPTQKNWQPYAGAGLAWIQEVDIDFESNGQEFSFSGDGDFGVQAFAGIRWILNDRLNLTSELRYTSFSDLELEAEPGSLGQLTGMEYNPLTFQAGLEWTF